MRWQIHAPSRAFVLQALCILSGILFGVQICSCNISWNWSSYHKTDNTRLTDCYAKLWKVTSIACCSRCHSDSSCKSVTYNPGSQECRLSTVSFTSVGSNSEQSDDWTTYSESDPCPEPWILYRRHCYRVVSTSLSWKESVKNCEKMGAHLTDVLDRFENSFVAQLGADAGVERIWLGLGNYRTIKPQLWTSGQWVNYRNFGKNEPNNASGNEDCILIRIFNSKWNDQICSYRLSSVCKKRHY